MARVGGSRAQSQVIGAVLIFAFIIAALGAAQVVLVPQNNEEVEFNHNQEAQQDMQDLRGAIQRSAAVGASQSESVDLSADYPTRFLLLNPGEGAGTIRTAGGTSLIIENASATDKETADFWNGSDVTAPSQRLIYSPNYNYYDSAPDTVYENSVLYNSFDGTDIAESGQSLVDDRRIYLIALDGNVSTSQAGAASVDVQSVSSATETISVERDGAGNPVNVTIPTQLSEEVWVQDLLAGEIDDQGSGPLPGPEDGDECGDFGGVGDNDRFIRDCKYTPGTPNKLTLIFQETKNGEPVTYNLKMAKIGVGSGVTTPNASYVTDIEGDGSAITSGQTVDLTLQARDKFNNPKSGEKITFNTTSGNLSGQSGPVTLQTNEEGKATVTFEPSIVSGEAEILGGNDTDSDGELRDEAPEDKAKFRVEVGNTFNGSGGIGSNINPSGPVLLSSANITGTTNMGGCTGTECDANVTLKNNASEDLAIAEMRVNYYDAQSPGSSASDRVKKLNVTDDEGNKVTLTIQNTYKGVTLAQIGGNGGTQTYTFDFEKADGTDYEVFPGDFFIVSVIYEDPDTGDEVSTFTYFVAPV